MDPLAPEFTRNLVRKTARIMAGMDRVIRSGGIATDEGLSAAVRAGMQHLAAHKGDVVAALASAKAAGAGHGSKPAADHTDFAVAASATANGAKFLSEVAAGLEAAAGVAETAGIGLAAAIVLAPTPAGPGEEELMRAHRARHAGGSGTHRFEPPPPSPPLPGLVPPPSPKTSPGEGGFTQAPESRPLPGFTPSPPSAPVHPGRPAEANKPIVVEAKTTKNSHLAGAEHPVTKIPFDKNGHPDFSGVTIKEVRIKQTGSRPGDARAANKAAGLEKTPPGYVWHHHQDGTTMQLVPEDIHTRTGHTGGFKPGK
jgi:hypothetical protein